MFNRFDPYRNYKKVAVGAVLAAAGFGLVRRFLRRSRSRELDPKDYIPKEPPPLPSPITVGSAAGRRRTSRAAPRTRASRPKKS